ncbi:metal-sensitive transcriptional regulator [Hydrogenibacillus schlegelii]|uniref:Cytoplasmic protein n=1 Tax=Hydrogenibacillus schlegelii TaxID=1484 RepID=A0A132N9C2_HYDSH|nr:MULTISPECIES: metal-sensitive transcriptional regulator [Hydrogenibacillus]KWX06718.1 cytoplasmic protein [Hydrogenibacillus schlegelii]OAR04002.1 cytoplasmic protein [Hydrogenibacillus schlegelii]PTQ51006.1 MAG: hypothetical protein HSCHL_1759 [Hydrogenibacillus schlegelii]QZA32577.1 metal-sensitive transcriptional regulator [Hydrogenibacillus sp. N12]
MERSREATIYDEKVKNRLKRIEGQARGILRMMEEARSCGEVVHQLSAMRAAVDRAIAYVIANYMEQCIREQVIKGEDTEQKIQEAIQLLTKSR